MPRELGHAHGLALRRQIRTFLDDDLARLNRVLPRQISLASLEPEIAAYRREIEAAAPSLAEEIEGLAEGAGIAPDDQPPHGPTVGAVLRSVRHQRTSGRRNRPG